MFQLNQIRDNRISRRLSCWHAVELISAQQSWLPATLIDVSESGARLRCSPSNDLPSSYELRLRGCKLAHVDLRWREGATTGVEFQDGFERDDELLKNLLGMRAEPAQMFMSLLRTDMSERETPTAGSIASFVQAARRRRT